MTVCQTTIASVSSDRTASKKVRRAGPFRLLLGLSTALTPVWAVADSLPTGGVVTSGQATISAPTTSTLLINQGSATAVVDWTGFSIGHVNTVTIAQPNSDAAILNRVTGDATSQIHGTLNANGQVYVVNPNGIFIGKTGTVNAGGFVASTLGIKTEDFVLGKPVFEGNGNSASVTNQGNITIVLGGYAALLGGKVSNSGVIMAPMGKIGLGAGERATLDFAGDGFLQVAIPSESDDEGLEALIENTGTISANGGQVHIQAATARNAVRHAINLGGIVEARSVSGRNGAITLGGGGGGIVRVTGKVRTAPYIQVTHSARPPQKGGDITITGNQITLEGATLDASGTGDGGTIRVGGNYQGGPGLMTADHLNVDAATRILADAGKRGDGGRVILWSDVDTVFAGNISARGGDLAGDGGFAEVSGKITLSYGGLADLRAPNGQAGMLLLDPEDIFIVETASGVNDIEAATVNAQLELGDLTLTTENPSGLDDGDIEVNAALNWISNSRLTLEADNDIAINAPITATQGRLTLDGFSDITATAAIDVGRFFLEGGDWVQNTASLPGFSTSDFSIGLDASFLRVIGGGGSNEDPYLLTDVYGLQGIGSGSYGFDVFVLANDIDATGTRSWNTLNDTFPLDTDGEGFLAIETLSGTLDGDGFAIDGLFVERSDNPFGSVSDHGGLIDTVDEGAFVRSLTLTNTEVVGATGGALAGLNLGTITAVSVIGGTVTGQGASDGEGFFELTPTGGLVAYNDGFITDSFSSAAVRTRLGDVTDQALGGLVGINGSAGLISTSRATGDILQQIGDDVDAGGLAGWNQGTITASVATAPNVIIRDATTANIGGLVGRNTGTISVSHADIGSVEGVEAGGASATSLNIGGLVGLNENVIEDAYALTDVTGRDTASLSIGGLIGRNLGSAEQVFSAGVVTSSVGDANIGGLIGLADSGSFVDAGFWDTDTSGQTASDGGAGLTTAEMQDTNLFLSLAEPAGWDLTNVWAPSDTGFYPAHYQTSPVIFGRPDADTFQYNGTIDDFPFSGSFAGGVDAYAFNEFGEVLDNTAINASALLSGADVGTQSVEYTQATITGDLGTEFRIVSAAADITITPAPLTITADDQTKTYGDLFTFEGTEFTADGLFAVDSITSVTLTSAGAPETAPITPPFSDLGGYVISISDPTGTGLGNYDIDFVAGALDVTPAPLTVTADDQSKVYGTDFNFDGSEFAVTGLRNSDTVTSVQIVSDGAIGTADVAGSAYAIVASDVTGTGLENYTLTLVDGAFEVTPAALQITLDDQTKVYGETFGFLGDEFVATGLLNNDSIDTVEITSAAQDATATVDDSPYDISAFNIAGEGLANYDITTTNGSFTVTPAPLTLTALDQTKTYGDLFTFEGNEFTALGLVSGDMIDSVDLASAGSAETAQVSDGPFAITISNPQGGSLSNYDVALVNGEMQLDRRNITITADDQTKLVDTEFVFDGSEFTVVGLVNDDEIASVDLFSEGAAIDATIEGSPYAITITAVNPADPSDGSSGPAAPLDASGLENYNITLQDGVMNVVDAIVGTPEINPIPPYSGVILPNPTDVIQLVLQEGATGGAGIQQSGSGAVEQATQTLESVDAAADRLDAGLASCDSSVLGFGSYVNCLAETLDEFSDALDGLERDLPRGLENVSAIIDNARDGVRAAGQRATRRLATATTAAQRRAIQADAANEARNALATAKSEIRKSITLIRAEDPDLRRVQTATVNRIVNAVEAVETKLVRAATL